MKTEIVQTVTFGTEGNAIPHQLYGWHRPEPGFTWMDGKESAIALVRGRRRECRLSGRGS